MYVTQENHQQERHDICHSSTPPVSEAIISAAGKHRRGSNSYPSYILEATWHHIPYVSPIQSSSGRTRLTVGASRLLGQTHPQRLVFLPAPPPRRTRDPRTPNRPANDDMMIIPGRASTPL